MTEGSSREWWDPTHLRKGIITQNGPRVVTSRENFDRSLALKGSDMRPHSHTAFIPQAQLSLCVVSAAIDVILVSKTERMVRPSRHHHHSFAQHGFDQNRLIPVLRCTHTQLTLGAVTASVYVTLVRQYERMLTS